MHPFILSSEKSIQGEQNCLSSSTVQWHDAPILSAALSPQAFYSAHPTTDRDTGETFNIGIGGAKGALEITKLSPDGVLQKSATYTPPASLFWHDNTITDEFVVAVSSPFAASLKSIFGSMLGFGQLGDAFRWDDNMKSEVPVLRVDLFHVVTACDSLRTLNCFLLKFLYLASLPRSPPLPLETLLRPPTVFLNITRRFSSRGRHWSWSRELNSPARRRRTTS